LKSSEAIEKLWRDSDGIPIAMDRSIDAKFSKFLIGYKITSTRPASSNAPAADS